MQQISTKEMLDEEQLGGKVDRLGIVQEKKRLITL